MCYLAFSDIREVRFTPDGNLDSRHAPETARAIAQLEIERTETKDGPRIRSKVRMYDKRQALVSLMLHCALSRKFGYRLRHLRRRVVDGRFLDLGGQTGGANRWVVRSDKEFFAGPR
jgi:hypothetical protein